MKVALLPLFACLLAPMQGNAATYVWNGDLTSGSWTQWLATPSSIDYFIIDRAYDQNRASMIRDAWSIHTSPNPVRFDFGLNGKVSDSGEGVYQLNGKQYQFSGTLDLTVDSADAGGAAYGEYVIETRWLITGVDIWYRDGGDPPNYLLSEFMGSNGEILDKLTRTGGQNEMDNNAFIGTDISDVNTGLTATAADHGKYAFVATRSQGIGVQYVRMVIPEPATTTLGLIGLGSLLLRRRR